MSNDAKAKISGSEIDQQLHEKERSAETVRLTSRRRIINLLLTLPMLAMAIEKCVSQEDPAITVPYEMSADDKKKNDEVNEKVSRLGESNRCKDKVMVGPNLMCSDQVTPEVDRGSPLVRLWLPGKDVSGNDQRPILRKQAVEGFWGTVQDCRKKTGIMLIANSAFRFNHVQDDLFVSLPGLASHAGYGRHAIDAIDISRKSANEERPNPMTLDVNGKVIFLEDLGTDEGKKRFAEVVIRINAEEIAQHPERKARIVEEWTNDAQKDFDNNVWGAMDACMESFQKFGSSISHCGVVSNAVNPRALRESWHSQPPRADLKDCKRWDKTYNANLLMYRKYPPMAEDEYFKRMRSSVENAKNWTKEKARNAYDWAIKKWNENK